MGNQKETYYNVLTTRGVSLSLRRQGRSLTWEVHRGKCTWFQQHRIAVIASLHCCSCSRGCCSPFCHCIDYSTCSSYPSTSFPLKAFLYVSHRFLFDHSVTVYQASTIICSLVGYATFRFIESKCCRKIKAVVSLRNVVKK